MKRSFDYKIGVISDTHGLIRKSVVKSFKGVDLIVYWSRKEIREFSRQQLLNMS